MKSQFLSDAQVQEFISRGYIVLKNAFPKDVASQWVDRGFDRLGYDRHNPATWEKPVVHMPGTLQVNTADFVPEVWKAACDLLGGIDRAKPYFWQDTFIFNLGKDADKPWQPASPKSGGWHKDGDFFRHFLDSPEQGLLTIVCWTDVIHQGGATFIAADSVPLVARHLADHPEGILPTDPIWGQLIHQCTEFVELTASAGDVVIHHPFMLHTRSQNVRRVERVITNPPAQLKEPLNFNREDAADFSPLELATLHALGMKRYAFEATHARESIVPERVRMQEKMRQEEQARMAAKNAVL